VVRPSEFVRDNFIPTRGSTEGFSSSTIISSRGSLVEFLGELGQLSQRRYEEHATDTAQVKSPPQLEHMLQLGQRFVKHPKFHRQFGRPITSYKSYCDQAVIALLETLHNAWIDATSFLTAHRVLCRAILSIHLTAFLNAWQEILRIQRQAPLRYPENAAEAQRMLMKLYFEVCRQKCIDALSGHDPDIVEEIWATILFRGILWHAIHNFDDKVVAVPPRYSDSNLPIYIS